ncbi:MAG TPA: TonB-dependent receptor [Vicinamibacterales bacterium]|nr:TonB-dependent receptor [Vicinamibacterales bacterium]
MQSALRPGTVLAILLAGFIIVPALASNASAQAISGTIEGQVKDSQGAVLPGVAITATNTGTGGTFSAVTTGDGLYRLNYLPLGTYEVRAEMTGFSTQTKTAAQVRLNESTVVDFTMGIAPLAQEITVTADSPVVQTTKSEMRRAYEERTLLDRPFTAQVSGFAGRSVYNFATLAPGVTTPSTRFDRAFLGSGGSNVVANGTTARSSNFELDGISNIDPEDNDYRVPVSVEGVKQLEVITGNYNAEFGRAGGAQVRAVTRSGSNTLHGSLYEFYYNNERFQDRGSPLQTAQFPEYTLNLYGGTVGGPLKRDKIFYFAMFENNVRRGENAASGLVPLPTERTPNTGSAAGDAIIRQWLDLYPLPNRTDLNVRRFETNAPFQYDTPNPLVRFDFNLNDATKLMARYDFRNQDFKILRVFKGNGGDIVDRGHTGGASLTRVFSSSLVGEFRFGYAYRRVDLPTEDGFEDFPTITIAGLSTLGSISNQYPIFRKLYDWQGIGSLAYVRGRHAFKAGYDLHRTFNNGVQSDYVRGLVNFGVAYGRSGIQNFLAGTPSSYQVTIGDPERNFRYWDVGLFVQDDWRVRDDLTLNLGFRNEMVTEWKERDSLTDFAYDSDFANPAPRAGAAWDLGGDGRWVLRGAYGLSYDRINFFHMRSLQFQPPHIRTITILPSADPLRVETLSPESGVVAGGTPARYDVSPDFELGRVHTWNLTLERDLNRTTVVRVGYVGSATRGLPSSLILNRAVPGPGATFANRQARRPDPTISNHLRLANGSDGNYRALQASLERRYSNGLQYQASYTWGRSLDMASDAGFGSGDIYFSMQWDADIELNDQGTNDARKDDLYGPSRYDMRHVASFNFSYELPWNDTGGIVGALIRDWTIAGTYYYRDGVPVSVTCGANSSDCNIDGVSQDRPNVVDASVIGKQFSDKPEQTSDTSVIHLPAGAFEQTLAPGARGTLARNQFRLDDFYTIDMAIVRNIRMFRDQRLQLRFELYNITNNTYAGSPGLSLASPGTFGLISSVGGNRSIQVAAKYLW